MAFVEDDRTEAKGDGSVLAELINQAASFVIASEDNTRSAAFDREEEYFDGIMKDLDGEDASDETDTGRSRAVSRDVADVIGWVMPQLMRVFMGADNVVDFEPDNEEDEQHVDDAELYINTMFRKKWKGYRLLWDGIHDAALHRTGILKAVWDHTPEHEERVVEDIDDMAWSMLVADPDVEVLTHKETASAAPQGEEMPNPMLTALQEAIGPGEMLEGRVLHSGKVRKVKSHGRLHLSVVPRKQFLIEEDATSSDDSVGVGEMCRKRRSDLVEMGFDKDKVWAIPKGSVVRDSARRHDEVWASPADTPKELDELDFYELYIRRDIDGDGVAERIKACFAGDICRAGLLHWEEWEEETHPYTELTMEPVPHRFDGRSYYDSTADIQKIKTAIERNLLDTVYDSVDPMRRVDPDLLDKDWLDESLEALQNPSAKHRMVFGKDGAVAPLVDKYPDMNAMMAAMTVQDAKIEKRTGISRVTQALDPEALQNQTATAAQLQNSAQYSKVELSARNLAELGLAAFFAKIYRLVAKYERGIKRVRVGKNKWREVRPEEWPPEMGVVVNIGLGTGNRERDVTGLTAIRQTQMGYMQLLGPGNPWVSIKQIRRTDEKIMQAIGVRNADAFISDPEDEEIAAWEQQRAQASQQPPPEVQMKMAAAQADAELKQQQAKQDHQLAMAKIEAETKLQRYKFDQEMQLKREQLRAELNLKARMEAMKAGAIAPSPVHVGGVPG